MDTVQFENYPSDPEFRVYNLPNWRARLYQFLSVGLWGSLPGKLQRKLSASYAVLYAKPYSRWIIHPYTRFYYRDREYLKKFKPPEGKNNFENFQDFFIREFRSPPRNEQHTVWPCEGLLCEQEKVGRIETVKVKCDIRTVATIFGHPDGCIPSHYSFSNIFLHNKNYHRIHAPVTGRIKRIQHIPGDLVVLRPWIYSQNPSLPAFRNERYNIDIKDRQGKDWFLSVVGGPAVGTIKINDAVKVGASVEKLEELAVFYLGSTCCMAAPIPPRYHKKNAFVEVGATY
jgi:phosphatidylserine decarboxylase